MSNGFFDRPIVSTPYEYPRQHWEVDGTGQPAAWQALPPPHQREYVKWITEAKTDATRTRTRRLETAGA